MHRPAEVSGFCLLDGNVLPAVRAAIAGNDTFVEKQHPEHGYVAFDYRDARNMAEVFPDPDSLAPKKNGEERWQWACRRECRGLLVCAETGRVLARRFHKFFVKHLQIP